MDKPVKINTKQYSMYFGAYLGVYMILKFILFPLALVVPFLGFFFIALTLGVPLVAYFYTRMFRNRVRGGVITFGQAYFFTVKVYFYAALLVSVAHFIYFQFIDNGFIMENVQAQLNFLLEANKDHEQFAEIEANFTESINTFANMTPKEITFNYLSLNITLGFILSFPTAFLVRKSPKL